MIGWIFCAVGLVFGAGIFASGYADYALHASSRPLPGVQYAAWFSTWASFPLWFLAATMLFLTIALFTVASAGCARP